MEEQFTNELIQYKTGFQSGKDEVIELTRLGKVISLNEETEKMEESWYDFGYRDAIDFYFEKINEGIDIAEIRTRDVVKELFAKRVIKYNLENNREVPISTFRMNK